MSAHWTVYCETHEVYGPDIRRSGSVTLQGLWPRYHPALTIGKQGTEREAQIQWANFLDEHEWCPLRLVRE